VGEEIAMAITEARAVGNALLGWPYRVEFNDYDPFLIQKCKVPDREFELSTFGGAGQTLDVKQAGGEKIGELTLESIVPAAGAQRTFWHDWQEKIRTRDVKQYWRDGTITLLGPDDNPNMVWDIIDAWPKKVEIEEFDSEDTKKLVKIKVTLECNDCIPRTV
jgi:phage tail-like protein